MKMMADAENNNKFRVNAQLALAQKNPLKPPNTKEPTFPPIESITDNFAKTINDKNLDTLVRRENLPISPITFDEVII